VTGRDGELARHIRRLGNHELNELLLQLPKPTFTALVQVALGRPVLPAGLVLRFEPAPGIDGGRWWPAPPAGSWARSPKAATRMAGWSTGPGLGPATKSSSALAQVGAVGGMRPRPSPG
jgi:hypothetical protein